MSDGQRSSSRILKSLGGIKPSRMPLSTIPEIPVPRQNSGTGIGATYPLAKRAQSQTATADTNGLACKPTET